MSFIFLYRTLYLQLATNVSKWNFTSILFGPLIRFLSPPSCPTNIQVECMAVSSNMDTPKWFLHLMWNFNIIFQHLKDHHIFLKRIPLPPVTFYHLTKRQETSTCTPGPPCAKHCPFFTHFLRCQTYRAGSKPFRWKHDSLQERIRWMLSFHETME